MPLSERTFFECFFKVVANPYFIRFHAWSGGFRPVVTSEFISWMIVTRASPCAGLSRIVELSIVLRVVPRQSSFFHAFWGGLAEDAKHARRGVSGTQVRLESTPPPDGHSCVHHVPRSRLGSRRAHGEGPPRMPTGEQWETCKLRRGEDGPPDMFFSKVPPHTFRQLRAS